MSDYRPWAPVVEETASAGDGGPATGDDEEPAMGGGREPAYAPWATAPGQMPPSTAPVSPGKEKRFESPPGLGEVPRRRKGDHAHETAAAMLLWTGGFLLFSSIAFMAAMTLAIDFEHIDMRHGAYGDYDDVQVMQQIRALGGWGIVASAAFLAPGLGLLYQQAWARPWGYVAASLALVLVPVGTVLGIVGLTALSRMEAR